MTIKISFLGSEHKFKFDSYSEAGFKLACISGDVEDVYVNTPLKLDGAYEDKIFDIYFLIKKNIRENDIYQVFDVPRDKRIGWCIPINALSSTDHDYADNEHFLRYAYKGISAALQNIDETIHVNAITIDSSRSLVLTDIFHENTVLLVISRETLSSSDEFNIDCAIPSLIQHGYLKLSNIYPSDITLEMPPVAGARLKIYPISKDIDSHQVISSLLSTGIACEKKAILQFFYTYQVIELLLEDIYKNEQLKILDELIVAAGDPSKAKGALEKAQRIASERKRIGLLINDYSKCQDKLSSLKVSCNNLLRSIGKDEGVEFEDYFYSIRNFIFHQYRDFPADKEMLLGNVVSEMIDVLPSLLSSYSKR